LLTDKTREFVGEILLRKNLLFLVLLATLPVAVVLVTAPTDAVFAGVPFTVSKPPVFAAEPPLPEGALGCALPTPGTDVPPAFTVSKPPELHCPLTRTAPGGHEIALPEEVAG
jgi:hypothetical protein